MPPASLNFGSKAMDQNRVRLDVAQPAVVPEGGRSSGIVRRIASSYTTKCFRLTFFGDRVRWDWHAVSFSRILHNIESGACS